MDKNQFLITAWVARAAHFKGAIETNFSYEVGLEVFKALDLPSIFVLRNSNGYLSIEMNDQFIPPEWAGIEGVSGAFSGASFDW